MHNTTSARTTCSCKRWATRDAQSNAKSTAKHGEHMAIAAGTVQKHRKRAQQNCKPEQEHGPSTVLTWRSSHGSSTATQDRKVAWLGHCKCEAQQEHETHRAKCKLNALQRHGQCVVWQARGGPCVHRRWPLPYRRESNMPQLIATSLALGVVCVGLQRNV